MILLNISSDFVLNIFLNKLLVFLGKGMNE